MGQGGMNSPLKTVRLFITLVNTIFFLTGATLLGEGIDILLTRRVNTFTQTISITDHSSRATTKLLLDDVLYLLLIVPGLVFLSIGFFGCSSAITQIQCLLFSYSCLVGLLLIFQMVVIIVIIVFRSQLQQQLIVHIRSFIRDNYRGPLDKNIRSWTYLWDSVMYYFQCCGITSMNDFEVTHAWNRTNPLWSHSMSIESRHFKYPLTCCPIDDILSQDWRLFNKAILCAMNGTDIYQTSCYDRVIDIVHTFQGTFIIIILLIILTEMLALIFVLLIHHRNQLRTIDCLMEDLPPPYPSRTRRNNSNIYFQI